MNRVTVLVLLAALVIVSAIQVVGSRHQSRRLFIELQEVRAATEDLNVEWGNLLLEEAAYATQSRVEQIATQDLRMRRPPPPEFARPGR